MQFAETIALDKIRRIQIYHNTKRYPQRDMDKILAETGGSFALGGPIYLASYQACCYLRADGVTYCAPNYTTYGMAWSSDAQDYGMTKLPSDKSNHIECVHMIVDGAPVDDLNYGADMGGSRPRQAIGAKEGRFAYIATQTPYTPEELRDVLTAAGWDAAVMLDGGGSVCYQDKDGAGFACDPDRVMPFYIVVHLKASVSDSDTDGAGKTVVLDAGHDASNLANKSPDGSYYEHEFALDMAKRIGAHLRRCGVTVVETRPDGAAVSLADRCAVANKIQGLDLFVSLHSNAAGGSGWSSTRGWSAYLYGAGGEREQAAKAILARVRETGAAVRSSPIVYDPALYVLKHTVAPAVLIEHAFHTNEEDVANLKDSTWRATVAEAEARGITDYLDVAWVSETPQEPHEPVMDSEAEQAVAWLTESGVMRGDAAGDLMLDQPLTRRQYAVMEYRKHLLGLQ